MLRRIFAISLVLSLLLHILLLVTVALQNYQDWLESRKKDVIEVTINEPPPMQKPEEQKKIVQQDKKAVNDETPEKPKYLGEHDQKVVKETRAQNNGDFTNKADKSDSEKESQKTGKVAKFHHLSDMPKTSSGLPTMESLKPQFDWNKTGTQESAKKGVTSKTDDYLKEVEVGAQTLLSTREFVYYSYYNRIREQLKQYWEPKIRDKVKKIFREGRSIASDQDRVTRVIIHLDKNGTLIKVQIIGESGIRDLDDAAVEAFRAAAPFPNPPKGIVDQDGVIKIRWDFILEA